MLDVSWPGNPDSTFPRDPAAPLDSDGLSETEDRPDSFLGAPKPWHRDGTRRVMALASVFAAGVVLGLLL